MTENKEQIFREKSLQRINSPEDLEKYVKTTNPSVWVLLLAIIVFLIGVITWSVLGKIETKATTGCVVEGGKVSCAVSEAQDDNITDKSYIIINDQEVSITDLEGPIDSSEGTYSSYITFAAGIKEGEWFYVAKGKASIPDGKYDATIVFESISPINFIIGDSSN